MGKNLNICPTNYRLRLKESACTSNLKTDYMCNVCKRNINLSEAPFYEYWIEPLLVKKFKDNSTRCSSFFKAK